MATQTYIYDKKEYVKTGRVAKKTEARVGRPEGKIKELVELRPTSLSEDNNEFNVWVAIEDLFEVQAS